MLSRLFPGIKFSRILMALVGSAILAFGLYNIHSISDVSEGGSLGLSLLFHHWFGVSPAISGILIDGTCYLIGWKVLGRTFVGYSLAASGGFSLFYAIYERFPRVYPEIADHPLAAALIGAVFIGCGAGIAVRAGGAPGGDDALAMALADATPLPIESIYLLTDLSVLLFSLSYIPLRRILYSVLTVVLSGQIVGLFQPDHGLYGRISTFFRRIRENRT